MVAMHIPSQLVKRSLLIVSIGMLLAVLAPPAVRAADFGVRTGAYTEEENAFLGAEALFNFSDQDKRWYGNPNVEHVFVEEGDLTTFSFDVHYDFPSGRPYTLWAGAGPTLIHRDQNLPGNDDSMDAGVNVLFGVGATRGDARPYGQVKMVVADDSEAVVGVGVRF